MFCPVLGPWMELRLRVSTRTGLKAEKVQGQSWVSGGSAPPHVLCIFKEMAGGPAPGGKKMSTPKIHVLTLPTS